MYEPRLFAGPPEVAHFACTYVVAEGWHLTVVMRRAGDPWTDSYRVEYSHLTTEELFDVLNAEAAHTLGIS